MFIKIGLLFICFFLGYFTCCLMTVSKINTIREEADEYIEYMRKTFEKRYNFNNLDIIFSHEKDFIPKENEIELPEVENGIKTN